MRTKVCHQSHVIFSKRSERKCVITSEEGDPYTGEKAGTRSKPLGTKEGYVTEQNNNAINVYIEMF